MVPVSIFGNREISGKCPVLEVMMMSNLLIRELGDWLELSAEELHCFTYKVI
jgi:hypothetical protein